MGTNMQRMNFDSKLNCLEFFPKYLYNICVYPIIIETDRVTEKITEVNVQLPKRQYLKSID